MDFDEDDILSTCALRFEGWKYAETTRWDYDKALAKLKRTGRFPGSDIEKLALFFMLQRWLYKLGGDSLPKTDREWKLFRGLFLQVCGLDVPSEFIHQGEPSYYRLWQNKYLSRLPEIRAFITRLHQSTPYT